MAGVVAAKARLDAAPLSIPSARRWPLGEPQTRACYAATKTSVAHRQGQEGEGSEGQGGTALVPKVLKPTGVILAEPDGNAGTYTPELPNIDSTEA